MVPTHFICHSRGISSTSVSTSSSSLIRDTSVLPKSLNPLRRELGKAVLQASLYHVAPVTAPRSPNNGPDQKRTLLLAPSTETYLGLIGASRRSDTGRK